MMKKTLSVIMLTGAIGLGVGSSAQAVGSFPYDGLNNYNYNQATNYMNSVGQSTMSKANVKDYEAIGRVSNLNGWKGAGKDSMGTGFVIDNHTFVTNQHVVETKDGKIADPRHIKMTMQHDNDKHKYTFNANSIHKINGADLVVINTRQDMSKYVEPLNLANEKSIDSIRTGDTLRSVGYDKYSPNGTSDNNKQMWRSDGFALMKTSNDKELMMKSIFRSGGSGSPLMNAHGDVVGIMAYGYNLDGLQNSELSGGFTFDGETRNQIEKYMK